MKPPPPRPATYGSVTPSVALAATAASIAFPPLLRIWIAVLVASRSTEAAAPPVPVATACDCAPAAAGKASATNAAAIAIHRCAIPGGYPEDPRRNSATGAPEAAVGLAGTFGRRYESVGEVDVRRDRQRCRITALREEQVEHPAVVEPDVGERPPVAVARVNAEPVT